MIKLLGIMDLVTALMFILVQWDIGIKIGIFCAIYLIVKSIIFISDFTSWVDLVAGIYLFLILFGIHSAFSVVFIIWLLQKGFFSLAS